MCTAGSQKRLNGTGGGSFFPERKLLVQIGFRQRRPAEHDQILMCSAPVIFLFKIISNRCLLSDKGFRSSGFSFWELPGFCS